MDFTTEETCARTLDAADSLAGFREEFLFPLTEKGEAVIYLCGNSLGLQPRSVKRYLMEELDAWEKLAVEGHFNAIRPWYSYHELFSDSLAKITGALPHEVVVMNTLTTNLHLAMMSFYKPAEERYKIITSGRMFPSDRYAVASHLKARGVNRDDAFINILPIEGSRIVQETQIIEALEKQKDSVALLLIEGVDYSTGQFYNIAELAAAAHRHGALFGTDLAHAVGNVSLELHNWEVDFAVWCSYKYLNGGPGCVAGLFVHERHGLNPDVPRFAGWWGHNKESRFKMSPQFEAIPGAEGWQLSNPPILSLAALRASLDIFDRTDTAKRRKKSEKLTSYLLFLLEKILPDHVSLITPREQERRGSQLSLTVKGGKEVHNRLTRSGVVCDWREPDIIRVAPAPLYNSFADVYNFVMKLNDALEL